MESSDSPFPPPSINSNSRPKDHRTSLFESLGSFSKDKIPCHIRLVKMVCEEKVFSGFFLFSVLILKSLRHQKKKNIKSCWYDLKYNKS